MIIEIEPLDTLFFRDGKPFTMGDDTWANAMFPPMPSVLYGAIRSAYLGQNDIDVEQIESLTQELKIKNICYRIATKEPGSLKASYKKYFPQPLDLVHKTTLSRKQKKNIEKYGSYDVYAAKLEVLSSPSNLCETEIDNILTLDDPIEGASNNFFTQTDLENYLKGKTDFTSVKLDDQTIVEPKIGIGRNNQKQITQEGLLYRVGLLRLQNFRILVEIDGLKINPSGIIKLGGEGKLASYKIVPNDLNKVDFSLDTLGVSAIDQFKVCLISPAIYENGFYPSPKYFSEIGLDVELIACALGKPIHVGGFDMSSRSPKEMFKAVPARSTYFYKLKNGNLKKLEEKIKDTSFSEYKGNEGFGLAYIGKI